jgi:hypothetical protein
MYVITARLLPTGAEPSRPDLDRLRESLSIESESDVSVGHVYARADETGVSLVLYLTAVSLSEAEKGAYLLLEEVIRASPDLHGWAVMHSGADLISPAVEMIIDRNFASGFDLEIEDSYRNSLSPGSPFLEEKAAFEPLSARSERFTRPEDPSQDTGEEGHGFSL